MDKFLTNATLKYLYKTYKDGIPPITSYDKELRSGKIVQIVGNMGISRGYLLLKTNGDSIILSTRSRACYSKDCSILIDETNFSILRIRGSISYGSGPWYAKIVEYIYAGDDIISMLTIPLHEEDLNFLGHKYFNSDSYEVDGKNLKIMVVGTNIFFRRTKEDWEKIIETKKSISSHEYEISGKTLKTISAITNIVSTK